MWAVNGNDLKVAEGDYGIALPVTISGATLGAMDTLKFTFKDRMNGEVILPKEYSGITDNTVNLEFTEAEIALFKVGTYVYSLDWYQNGSFLCNIIPSALFRVVDKA